MYVREAHQVTWLLLSVIPYVGYCTEPAPGTCITCSHQCILYRACSRYMYHPVHTSVYCTEPAPGTCITLFTPVYTVQSLLQVHVSPCSHQCILYRACSRYMYHPVHTSVYCTEPAPGTCITCSHQCILYRACSRYMYHPVHTSVYCTEPAPGTCITLFTPVYKWIINHMITLWSLYLLIQFHVNSVKIYLPSQ